MDRAFCSGFAPKIAFHCPQRPSVGARPAGVARLLEQKCPQSAGAAPGYFFDDKKKILPDRGRLARS
jgi:hypothetical protein